MSITQQDIMLLRSLKKTAIIILLLMRAGKSLTGKEIGELLEINRDTALGYLKSLEAIGLVQNLGKFKGYTFTKSGVQLAFPGWEKHKNPAFVPSSVSNDLSLKDSKDLKTKILTPTVEKQENPAFLENKTILGTYGIGNPRLSELANLEHVNPKYIKVQYWHWEKENQKIGLLIHRIKNQYPAPERKVEITVNCIHCGQTHWFRPNEKDSRNCDHCKELVEIYR